MKGLELRLFVPLFTLLSSLSIPFHQPRVIFLFLFPFSSSFLSLFFFKFLDFLFPPPLYRKAIDEVEVLTGSEEDRFHGREFNGRSLFFARTARANRVNRAIFNKSNF